MGYGLVIIGLMQIQDQHPARIKRMLDTLLFLAIYPGVALVAAACKQQREFQIYRAHRHSLAGDENTYAYFKTLSLRDLFMGCVPYNQHLLVQYTVPAVLCVAVGLVGHDRLLIARLLFLCVVIIGLSFVDISLVGVYRREFVPVEFHGVYCQGTSQGCAV